MDINFNQIKRDNKMDSINTAEETHTTLERNADVESKESNSMKIGNNETNKFIPSQKKKRKYTSTSVDISNLAQSSSSSDNLLLNSDLNTGDDERKFKVNATSKGSFRKLKFDCSFESGHLLRKIVKSDFSGIKSDEISGKITDGTISVDVASHISSRNDEMIDSMMETEYTSEVSSDDVAGPSGMRPEMIKKSEKKVFVCGLCPEEFERSYDFDIHYRNHRDEKLFVCDVCKREFTRKGNLERHYLTHTGEKPFECDVCQCKFSQKVILEKHYRTHTGEKPFVCEVCEKGFAQKAHLGTHYRTHTDEKPFVCDVCEKGFTTQSDLTRHVRTHTGEKPYECNICGMAFTDCSNRNRHYKKKHK